MAFLSDLRRFYGTGEKNPAGQSLEEFLEHYNRATCSLLKRWRTALFQSVL